MKTFLKFIMGTILVVVFAILFIIAKNYSYIEKVEIEKKNGDGEYELVMPYEYNVKRIKESFMFTNLYKNYKIKKKNACTYKVTINGKDIICYDKGDYALYMRQIETISDIKEKVKEKDITAVEDKHYKKTTIKLNKSFIKMLEELEVQ